jgi:hypothetical protein
MRRFLFVTIVAFASAIGTVCSSQAARLDCDRLIEGVINSEDVKRDPDPFGRALIDLEQRVPDECRATSTGYIPAKAFFTYALGRVNEAEQLITQLDWRNSSDSLALSTAAYLIMDEGRLDGSIATAEALARRYIELSPRSIRAHHLLGEVMMEQDRAGDVVDAFKTMRKLRKDAGMAELQDHDIDYLPYLSEVGNHSDVMTILLAAESSGKYPVWESEAIILSALLAASELRDDSAMRRLILETQRRRPDVAAKESFGRIRRSFEAIQRLGASEDVSGSESGF